jgi:hypothetical protein
MVGGRLQVEVVGLEEVLAHAEDQEGHFVAGEILPEALWQRSLSGLPESRVCWTSILQKIHQQCSRLI